MQVDPPAAPSASADKGKGRAAESAEAPHTAGITKRKLETALEGLTDVWVTATAGPGKAGKRKAPRYRETPTFSTSKLMKLLKPPAKPVEPTPRASPSSDPHSLPALLLRLSTLRTSLFPDTKPRGLDAATVARHGWQSAGKRDEVRCTTCGARWRVESLGGGRGWQGAEGTALVQERIAQLIGEHQPACPWRVRQSPVNLYRLPLSSLPTLLADLTARCESYTARPAAVQGLTLSPLNDLVDLPTLRATLDRRRPAGPFDPNQLSDDALILALCGWSLSASSHLSTLSCLRCHRTISIATFTKSSRPFDAVAEHRPFCAFVEEAAWRRQLPRRLAKSGSHGEGAENGFAWAWQGEGIKRRLATNEVKDYVRSVLDARGPVRSSGTK